MGRYSEEDLTLHLRAAVALADGYGDFGVLPIDEHFFLRSHQQNQERWHV